MKNRVIVFVVILINLLAFFLWAVFFYERKPVSHVDAPNSQTSTDPEDVIEQKQPEISIYDANGLMERDGAIYVGKKPVQVHWENQTLIHSREAVDIGYAKDYLFYGLSGTDLLQIIGEKKVLLAEGVSDIRYLEHHILFLNQDGVQLLSVGRNTIQRLLENTDEMPVTSLDTIFLSKGTQYYILSDEENNTFEIYINETKELLSIVEGHFLSASPTDAIVLYGESFIPTRLGVYYIETSTDTQILLTDGREEVITKPVFDDKGQVRYLTTCGGVLYSNTIELETRLRNRVELSEQGKFVEDLWVDGYYVISFTDRFYYGRDPQSLSYYDTSFDKIRFKGDDIFLCDGPLLRVIRKDQYKEYSLKGVPVEILPAGEYFYYTYHKGTQPFVSRIKIQF